MTRLPEWMQAVFELNPLIYSVHGVNYWFAGVDVGFDYMNWYINLLTARMFPISLTVSAAELFEKTTIED